jgi:co-chaperonin GroES (HSP10)
MKMKIPRPLKDNLIARPVEETNKQGLLIIPPNYQQALRTHFRCVVVGSGPLSKEMAPVGSIIHVSESWGEKFIYEGNMFICGRLRDINGVIDGEALTIPEHLLS